jgi:hypothetical protein
MVLDIYPSRNTNISSMSSNIKRVQSGIGGIDTDSDNEVEIDTSATLTSGALDIVYTEHVSKRQKQEHSVEWNNLGLAVDELEGKQVYHTCFPPGIANAIDLTNFYRARLLTNLKESPYRSRYAICAFHQALPLPST